MKNDGYLYLEKTVRTVFGFPLDKRNSPVVYRHRNNKHRGFSLVKPDKQVRTCERRGELAYRCVQVIRWRQEHCTALTQQGPRAATRRNTIPMERS